MPVLGNDYISNEMLKEIGFLDARPMYRKLVYRCFDCPANTPNIDDCEYFLTLNEVNSQEEQNEMQQGEVVPSYKRDTIEIWGLCSRHRGNDY